MPSANSLPLRQPVIARYPVRHCRGQALIEGLYVALTLSSLFLLIPMIGKYQDIAHATQMASRYAALDSVAHHAGTASGHKSKEALANEIRQRFFGANHRFIQASDSTAAAIETNQAWRTPFGQPLIASAQDVQITFGANASVATEDAYVSASDRDIFNQRGGIEAALANRLNLPAGGLFRANVSVRIANLPSKLSLVAPFDHINLQVERATAVLHDTWAADHPATVESRVAKLVPVAEGLRNLEPALEAIVFSTEDMGKVDAPHFNRLEQWRDMVPPDRMR